MRKTSNYILLLSVALLFLGMKDTRSIEKTLLAGDVIARIKTNIDAPWQSETVDTFKSGGPHMQITGIATTFMATLEVLQKAKARNLNLIISHEPTFYNHLDQTDTYGNDSIVAAKQKYIEENKLTIFRFHDHWHSKDPDGIYKGVVAKMDWEDYEYSQRPYLYELPRTTLKKISKGLMDVFKTKSIRVVGNPDSEITKVGLVLGAAGSKSQIEVLQRRDVQLLIVGETREWETVPYVYDAASMGKSKSLIILGHETSEEAGMDYCADWISTFVNEVPVEFISTGNPFWNPGFEN